MKTRAIILGEKLKNKHVVLPFVVGSQLPSYFLNNYAVGSLKTNEASDIRLACTTILHTLHPSLVDSSHWPETMMDAMWDVTVIYKVLSARRFTHLASPITVCQQCTLISMPEDAIFGASNYNKIQFKDIKLKDNSVSNRRTILCDILTGIAQQRKLFIYDRECNNFKSYTMRGINSSIKLHKTAIEATVDPLVVMKSVVFYEGPKNAIQMLEHIKLVIEE